MKNKELKYIDYVKGMPDQSLYGESLDLFFPEKLEFVLKHYNKIEQIDLLYDLYLNELDPFLDYILKNKVYNLPYEITHELFFKILAFCGQNDRIFKSAQKTFFDNVVLKLYFIILFHFTKKEEYVSIINLNNELRILQNKFNIFLYNFDTYVHDFEIAFYHNYKTFMPLMFKEQIFDNYGNDIFLVSLLNKYIFDFNYI